MTRILLAMLVIATAIAGEPTPTPVLHGKPFGQLNDADLDRLQEFAVKHGADLKADLARSYTSKGVDEAALGRVFIFSRHFTALDKNGRTYGQLIYNSLLNIGEQIGVPAYARIINRQPPDI